MRGEDLDRVAEAGDAADRNRVRWIEGALERVEKEIREVAQRVAEQAREMWDRGPDLDIGAKSDGRCNGSSASRRGALPRGNRADDDS